METRSFLDASSAGHKPQSSAVTIARVPENVTTRQSSRRSTPMGSGSVGTIARSS